MIAVPRESRSSLSRFVAGVMAATLAFTSLAAVAGTPANSQDMAVDDDETVYVVADATGAPRSTVVIDWLRFDADGEVTVTDHGEITAAEAIEEDIEPVIEGDAITWTIGGEGRRDFFYRADTAAPLPVDVAVAYTLDGREVTPEELAGSSGHVRIDVTVTNNLPITEDVSYTDADGVAQVEEAEYWVPLLAPVKIDVDGTRFTNIEGDAEIVSVTGSTISHTFMAFPQPESTVTIEMDGSDIAIDPIIVSVFPKMAGEPDFSVIEQLSELRTGVDGLSMLSSGHQQVLTSIAEELDPSAYGDLEGQLGQFDQLTAGVAQLRQGTEGLTALTSGQLAYLDGILGQLEGQDLSAVAALPSALTSMTAGIEGTKAGLDGIIALLDGQMALLDALAASNSGLEATAWQEAGATGDATATALATGLSGQTAMIEALRHGDSDMGLPYGLDYTRTQLATISGALGDIAQGLDLIATQSGALTGLPGQMQALESSLRALRDGGIVQGQVLPGLTTTRDGLAGVTDGLREMETGLQSSSGQLDQLAELPSALDGLRQALVALRDGGQLGGVDLPGISTTVDGLNQMSAGLGDGISEGNLGQAIVERMKQAAEDYDTFLGKPDGATGDVRFIFKLDGISAE